MTWPSPPVSVPVVVQSGQAAAGGSIALPAGRLDHTASIERAGRHVPVRADGLASYAKATDASIVAGLVLPEDRAEMLAEAQARRIAG